MIKKIYIMILFLVGSVFCFSFAFAQEVEEIRIVTYYPAPYGSYTELRSNRLAIGDTFSDAATYSWGSGIDSDADLVVEGKVGIGIAIPGSDAMMHIFDQSNHPARIVLEGTGSGYTHSDILLKASHLFRGTGIYTFNSGTGANWYFGNQYKTSGEGSDKFIISRKTSATFYPNAPDPNLSDILLSITNTGNVGIGTVDPLGTLVVGNNVSGVGIAGNSWISVGLSGAKNVSGIVLGSDSVANRYLQLGWNDNSNYAEINTSGATQPLVLQNSSGGNVGIGTVNPVSDLHIYSANAEALRLDSSDSTRPYINFRAGTYNLGYVGGAATVIGTSYLGVGLAIRSDTGIQLVNSADGTYGMTIRNGRVGIGTINPAYQLQLSTNSAGKPTSNTWTVVSDKRLKKDITPFLDGLDVITKVNPVNYKLNGLAGTPLDAEGISVIGQDIEMIAPYTIVKYKAKLHPEDIEKTELINFDASALTFVLINAVKELNDKNTALVNQYKNLEGRIQVLEQTLNN